MCWIVVAAVFQLIRKIPFESKKDITTDFDFFYVLLHFHQLMIMDGLLHLDVLDLGRKRFTHSVQAFNVVLIDAGSFFKRIPEVRVKNSKDDPGYGVKVSPIMNVVPRDQVPLPQAIEVIYCPAKSQQNYTEI